MRSPITVVFMLAMMSFLTVAGAWAQTQIGVAGGNGGAVAYTYDNHTGKAVTSSVASGTTPKSMASAEITSSAPQSNNRAGINPNLDINPVPEPATLAMLGSGLLAAGSILRIRKGR
jgi:flagellar hook-length control protein FliK